MKARRDKDLIILEKTNLETEELVAWINDLFGVYKNDGIREEVLNFGFEVMIDNYAKAKSEKTKKMILIKILHTLEVVEAGFDIASREKEMNWNLGAIGEVTFLHDMGRFAQAHFESYSDYETNFDHADCGAETVLMAEFDEYENRGITNNELTEAIREHSKIEYLGENIYAKLVRDADKLGLINYFHYHLKNHEWPKGKISEGALEAYLDGKLVPRKFMKNEGDVILCWLSWEFDINFEGTKKLIEESGMKEFMLNLLRETDEKVWKKVRDLT